MVQPTPISGVEGTKGRPTPRTTQEGKSSTRIKDSGKDTKATDPRQARPNRDAEKRLLDQDETQRLPGTRGARYSCGRREKKGAAGEAACRLKPTTAQVGRVEALALLVVTA